MKENNELERSDIVVLRDMEIDDESGQEIIAYLETWFDVDTYYFVWRNLKDSTFESNRSIALSHSQLHLL